MWQALAFFVLYVTMGKTRNHLGESVAAFIFRCLSAPVLNKEEGTSSMAYVISDECISCGACEADCPVSAISEGDGKYVIDADTCIDCGACAGTCPVGAPHEA